MNNQDWRKLMSEGESLAIRQLSEQAAKNAVSRDFFGAALTAKHQIKEEGLTLTVLEYGETSYTAEQGLKAACHAREDVIAILHVQHSLLKRLQGIKNLTWTCLLVLIYIAIRVT